MSIVHPAGRAAAGGLPLPDVDIASRGEMQAAAGHGGGRAGIGCGPAWKVWSPARITSEVVSSTENLSSLKSCSSPDLKTLVKQVPAVGFLDQGQVLQRAGGILPGEQKIRPGAVMHRAYFDPGFSLAVEIAALAGHQGKRRDVSPRPIGGVAVEDRRVGAD